MSLGTKGGGLGHRDRFVGHMMKMSAYTCTHRGSHDISLSSFQIESKGKDP